MQPIVQSVLRGAVRFLKEEQFLMHPFYSVPKILLG